MPQAHEDGRPLIFGEVLFDTFPDGVEVLGGAPFNVAWHLQGFGLAPLMVSRVGRDGRGDRILETMLAWGMDTAGLQRDDDYPTGIVSVTFDDGQPAYDIVADQAYDHIDAAAAIGAVGADGCGLLYHGTLALRADASRDALGQLRRAFPQAPVCVDINLREPWWQRELVVGLLRDAAWVKLNDVELALVTGGSPADRGQLEQAATRLRQQYDIGTLLVTLGASGAFVHGADGRHHGEPAPVPRLIDTVGAGDAFSAVSLVGLLSGWSADVTLARALAFASAVCGLRGATTDDRTLYDGFLRQWERDSHG